MNTDYPYKFDKLENDFQNILELNQRIEIKKATMKEKLMKLKEMHTSMSKSNNKQIFLFSLDSFFFQYKTFSMELENLNKFSSMFRNRTYCDYYKLFKLISKYINEHADDLDFSVDNNLTIPVYKDLEPFYDYGLDNVRIVHEQMILYVKKMYQVLCDKEKQISDYATKAHAGYSISNFVNTLNHENNILKGQIDLYINYISFFHISQQKQIKRLHNNYVEFDKDVETNLNSDHAFSFDDLSGYDSKTLDEKDEIPLAKESSNVDMKKTGVDENTEKEATIESNELKQVNEDSIPVFTELKETNTENNSTDKQ